MNNNAFILILFGFHYNLVIELYYKHDNESYVMDYFLLNTCIVSKYGFTYK